MEKLTPETVHIGPARVWREGRFAGALIEITGGRIKLDPREVRGKTPFLIPPFAEPHIHGGWGISIQRSEFGQLEDRLRRIGILFAIPTLINTTLERLEQTAEDFEAYLTTRPDSIFPFLRVEGPFISPHKKGIQPDEYILPLTEKNIRRFLSIRAVKMFTFAPELERADVLVTKALAAGKIPSIGHSAATYARFREMTALGVRHITHYPNALSSLHHREPGLVGAGLISGECHLEVIGDLIHSSREFMELLLKVRGPVFSLTADLIPPACGGGGEFEGRQVSREGRRLTDGKGTIAGGATTVPDQVRLLVGGGFRLEDMIRAACLNAPAFFGRPPADLVDGAPATCVLLSEDLGVKAVFSGGRPVGSVENAEGCAEGGP
jgi:N-acetylglucosamine-6-phosphate deacetylase